MNLTQAYERTAERYLGAASMTLQAGRHEVAIFTSYHAFESIGGALSASHGQHYPRSHSRKLNQFTKLCAAHGFGPPLAHLAILLSSLRNLSLYPVDGTPAGSTSPDLHLSPGQAKSLYKRVQGLVQAVKRII